MENDVQYYKPIESEEEFRKMVEEVFSSVEPRESIIDSFRRCNPVGWQAVEKAIEEEFRKHLSGEESFFSGKPTHE